MVLHHPKEFVTHNLGAWQEGPAQAPRTELAQAAGRHKNIAISHFDARRAIIEAMASTSQLDGQVASSAGPLDVARDARVRELMTTLSAHLSPQPDELILLELAASELPIVEKLEAMQLRLAQVMNDALHDARTALTIAKVWRELTYLSSAAQRRVRDSFDAAAVLRARRRFMEEK